MLSYLHKVMRDTKDRGASAVEYGLMVAAIAAVIVVIVFALGGVIKNVFDSSCTAISNQTTGTTTGTAGTAQTCAPTH